MSTTKAAAAPESGGSASSQIEEGDDRAYLEARWRAVVGKGDGGAEAAAAAAGWWEQVAREYGGPGRRYHALSHLRQMFGEADRHNFNRPDLVALAIFFHDLIYNPKSGTNEEDSADRFKAFATGAAAAAWLPEADATRVVRYILATKSHSCDDGGADDEDLRLFLDIDMSILGQPRDTYLRYAAQIRQEYAHVPRPTYLTARANVLSSFLGRERIFVSEYYHGRLEAPARGNVAAEVALLRGGVIPGERQEEGEEG